MIKLIAETAWHHEGDFGFMKDLVTQICQSADVDYIKMHITLDLDEYMCSDHDAYKTLSSWTLLEEQWESLIGIVRANKKHLMLLLNDTKAIEFAAKFNPEIIELHSVCLNVPRLQQSVLKCFNKGTKICIGVGGCTLNEVDAAVGVFEGYETILMFGFQNYPTKYEDVNLEKVRKIQSLYANKKFGYADHTAWNELNNELITLLVASNGMSYIEKHVTTMYGVDKCDYSAAISLEMCSSLSKKLKFLNCLKGNGLLALNRGEEAYSQYGAMKMAAMARSELNPGDVLERDSFDFLRTGQKTRISQVDILKLVGEKIVRPVPKGQVIDWDCFGG